MGDAPLDPAHHGDPAVPDDVRCLGGPRRNRPNARNDEQCRPLPLGRGIPVGQETLQDGALSGIERALALDEVPVLRAFGAQAG